MNKVIRFIIILLLTGFVTMLYAQTGEVVPYILGDANRDEVVNIIDTMITAQHSVGLDVRNLDEKAADVNCDNMITIMDALMIAQYYIGILKTFPCENNIPEEVELTKPSKIQYGRTVQFDGENTLRFAEVVSDSRCPSDVFCVWEGEVTASLVFTDSTQKITVFELSSVVNPEKTIRDYHFKIDALVFPPRGLQATPIDKEDYIITLTITNLTRNMVWIDFPSGPAQCEPAYFSSEEDLKDFLEKNDIKVYNTKTKGSIVCAACGCPTGIEYHALISWKDLLKVQELKINLRNFV